MSIIMKRMPSHVCMLNIFNVFSASLTPSPTCNNKQHIVNDEDEDENRQQEEEEEAKGMMKDFFWLASHVCSLYTRNISFVPRENHKSQFINE